MQISAIVPLNTTSLISLPSLPDPIPTRVSFVLIFPPNRNSIPTINRHLAVSKQIPITESNDELLVVMFPFIRKRFSTVQFPEESNSLPIPDPDSDPDPDHELLAVIFPFTIVRFTTVELLLEPYLLLMPEPEPSTKRPVIRFQFMIGRFTTTEPPSKPNQLPIPKPNHELFVLIFQLIIARFSIIDLPFKP